MPVISFERKVLLFGNAMICRGAAIRKLDDGREDSRVVARVVVSQCLNEHHAIADAYGFGFNSEDAQSMFHDMALADVLEARAQSRQVKP